VAHRYRLTGFGLDTDGLDRRLAGYRAEFGV